MVALWCEPECFITTAALAGLLIPQGVFPQSAVITDTPLLLKSPCENTIRRDISTRYETFGLIEQVIM
ncbi:hypothetical protein BW247_13715 [Acidihalobacter ferrooxydans]|uniref:Uncharacterized protein n=1 Tax=Acidihalobacter ferrooxydans TaxID=1765967 RepID=A0A1P8UJK2_9GAMM|nr:hypothetical protein BW247_13715 [Acidihalobacter ferrooxydans]